MSNWQGKLAKDHCRPLAGAVLTLDPADGEGLGVRRASSVPIVLVLGVLMTAAIAIWWIYGWLK